MLIVVICAVAVYRVVEQNAHRICAVVVRVSAEVMYTYVFMKLIVVAVGSVSPLSIVIVVTIAVASVMIISLEHNTLCYVVTVVPIWLPF